ncbi:MAG: UDP-N-acetylmuramoyl-L-alanyl-D-glutamate--2,6-diaminopimelate ligase [Chloroflexi bacterium]|nr:MAG: UDP-N-acetylmuramoyl-L-alanyl-D-glutamate--2,6-diaminopimelate ligase [Chloroflexota bacterium]TMF50496.1 MAG: UDP-N-acetylmuramoyl-L-alanyl-D-glutamate--2,6-diaminopimelate ligase [Chloroflexota bacterium]
MRLSDLAQGAGAVLEGNGDVEVTGIAYDSRRVAPGDLFVAVQGLHVDGHVYLTDAVAKGAVALAIERDVKVPAGIPVLHLVSTRTGLAELSAEFYGRPSRRLKLAGVTGTDGKTTVTHMAEHVLQASGIVAGAMSTVAFKVSGREVDNVSGQTTTEAPEVQGWLARMVEAGAACAVIETTSHALVQERVHACDFDVAAFTNVGHDHLDYHASWEEYIEAKARLIDLTSSAADKGVEKTAVLNRDDPSYERLARRPISRRWTYGLTTASDLHPLDLAITGSGSRFRMQTPMGETEVTLNVPARFNIYNALCAAGVCLALGVQVEDVGRGLAGFEGVRGRLEPVDLGQDFRVYIDFAHAAGSLASALAELRPFTRGRLIAVFGSTARSDHDRPGMGRAAAEFSDFFIITTDDPLSEDPTEIARDVQAGAEGKAPGRDFEVVIDRRAAIRRAIEIARPGDTVLLAGKGHERSMRTARGSEPWDERAEAEAAIRERLAVN